MPFEAKFLNLSSDTYKLFIVEPSTSELKNSIELNETENKSLSCPYSSLYLHLKNLTNTSEELFFVIPKFDLYTIDKDYSTNSTIIKNDMENKTFAGEKTFHIVTLESQAGQSSEASIAVLDQEAKTECTKQRSNITEQAKVSTTELNKITEIKKDQKVTFNSLEEVREQIQVRTNYGSNNSNPLGLSNSSLSNGVTADAKASAIASNFTSEQIPSFDTNTLLSQIFKKDTPTFTKYNLNSSTTSGNTQTISKSVHVESSKTLNNSQTVKTDYTGTLGNSYNNGYNNNSTKIVSSANPSLNQASVNLNTSQSGTTSNYTSYIPTFSTNANTFVNYSTGSAQTNQYGSNKGPTVPVTQYGSTQHTQYTSNPSSSAQQYQYASKTTTIPSNQYTVYNSSSVTSNQQSQYNSNATNLGQQSLNSNASGSVASNYNQYSSNAASATPLNLVSSGNYTTGTTYYNSNSNIATNSALNTSDNKIPTYNNNNVNYSSSTSRSGQIVSSGQSAPQSSYVRYDYGTQNNSKYTNYNYGNSGANTAQSSNANIVSSSNYASAQSFYPSSTAGSYQTLVASGNQGYFDGNKTAPSGFTSNYNYSNYSSASATTQAAQAAQSSNLEEIAKILGKYHIQSDYYAASHPTTYTTSNLSSSGNLVSASNATSTLNTHNIVSAGTANTQNTFTTNYNNQYANKTIISDPNDNNQVQYTPRANDLKTYNYTNNNNNYNYSSTGNQTYYPNNYITTNNSVGITTITPSKNSTNTLTDSSVKYQDNYVRNYNPVTVNLTNTFGSKTTDVKTNIDAASNQTDAIEKETIVEHKSLSSKIIKCEDRLPEYLSKNLVDEEKENEKINVNNEETIIKAETVSEVKAVTEDISDKENKVVDNIESENQVQIKVDVQEQVKVEIKEEIETKQEVQESQLNIIDVKETNNELEVKEEIKPVDDENKEEKEEVKPVDDVNKEEVRPVDDENKEEVRPVDDENKEEVKPVEDENKEEIKPVDEENKEEVKPVEDENKEEVKPVDDENKEEVKPVEDENKEEVKPVDPETIVENEIKSDNENKVEDGNLKPSESQPEADNEVKAGEEIKKEVKEIVIEENMHEDLRKVSEIIPTQEALGNENLKNQGSAISTLKISEEIKEISNLLENDQNQGNVHKEISEEMDNSMNKSHSNLLDMSRKKSSIKIQRNSICEPSQKVTPHKLSDVNNSQLGLKEFKIDLVLNYDLVKNYQKNQINFSKSVYGKLSETNLFTSDFDVFNNNDLAEIKISNKYPTTLYIRVSGDNKEDESLVELQSTKSITLKRNKNKIHKLQICADKINKTGPVFNLFCNFEYVIDSSLKLFDSNSNQVVTSYARFTEYKSSGNRNNKIFVFYNNELTKNVELLCKFNSEKYVSFFNASENEVSIRVKSDENSDDDVYTIYPFMQIFFERKPDCLFLTQIKTQKRIFKYELSTNFVYVLDNQNKLTSFPNNQLIELKDQTNKINAGLRYRSEALNKLTKELSEKQNNSDIYFKYEHFEFDEENYNEFNIENLSNESVYVRVEKKTIGDECFFEIKPGQDVPVVREDGLFLAEIVRTNFTSKRYILNTNYCFTIDKQYNLLESISTKLIPNTLEKLPGFKLVLGDLNTEIDYNSDVAPPLVAELSKEDLAYFNDLEPKYIKGRKFADDSFPNKNYILTAILPQNKRKVKGNNLHTYQNIDNKYLFSVNFKRPEEIFSEGKYYLFNENNNDELCYETFFTTIIYALNQNKGLLKRNFRSIECNKDGFYEVVYYESGEKKIMYIDDFFPVSHIRCDNNGVYYFSKPEGSEIWLQILEKCYAKYEGGYANILDGNILAEIYFLTGCLSSKYSLKEPNVYDILSSAASNSAVIIAGCNIGDDTDNVENFLSSFTYTILDFGEFDDGKEIIQLIKLKDPSSKILWEGAYQEDSDKWTPQLKKYFDVENGFEKGTFYITFEEFQQNFDYFVVAFTN